MPPNASNLQPPSAQPGRVPNLTYRNASPEKEPGPLRGISNLNNDTVSDTAKGKGKEPEVEVDDVASGQEKPRLTIKQLREAAQNAVQAQQEEEEQPTSPPPQQKKRSSIFGSLFQVKEPTQVALNQVAAQMKAQHGSTNPTKVPNVRMEKMPEYVPKVNTKWDGIPDSVKKVEKEKKAREKGQASTDYSVYQNRGRGQLNSRNSSSTTGSFGSRGRSSGSYSNSTRPHFYAHSVNSSGDLASQQRTDRPPQRAASLHSQAASNTSEASFPEPSPEIPRLTGLTPIDEPPSPKSRPTPGIDALPARSVSPLAIPQDTSTLAPSRWQTDAHSQQESESSRGDRVTLTSSGPGVLGPPTASKSTRRSVASEFLSGEARELVVSDNEDDDNGESPQSDLPLRNRDTGGRSPATPSLADPRPSPQKRSDDTRTRLGLRLKDDDTPREKKKSPVGSPRHAPESGVPSPRTKLSKSFSLLGKGKEKKAT